MKRHILSCLAWAGLAVAIFAVWPTTSATAQGRQTGAGLSIKEIEVTFEDAAHDFHDTITITVEGLSQPDPGTPTVTLGNRGELDVISVGPDQIVAFCPLVGAEYICEEGDALLMVSVQPGGASDTSTALSDSVSLTIGAVGPPGEQGPQGEPGESGTNVRVASFFEENTSQCSYNCTAPFRPFQSCDCSCTAGLLGSCTCFCESGRATGCSEDSCSVPSSTVSCPAVGGNQGQSELASCSGEGVAMDNGCTFATAVLTGPETSCANTAFGGCSCSCGAVPLFTCECSCTPSGGVSGCTSPTRTASRTEQAICLKVESAT